MKICKECGRELPDNAFQHARNTCYECINTKRATTRYKNALKMERESEQQPFPDADFDDKTPGEVIRLMGRAKVWLESRGCSITLRGEYREVKIRQVKFLDK